MRSLKPPDIPQVSYRVVEGFTSDSFGIGLRLFLDRFVGRYLQFSQMMSGDTFVAVVSFRTSCR